MATPDMPPLHPAAELFPMMSEDELRALGLLGCLSERSCAIVLGRVDVKRNDVTALLAKTSFARQGT